MTKAMSPREPYRWPKPRLTKKQRDEAAKAAKEAERLKRRRLPGSYESGSR